MGNAELLDLDPFEVDDQAAHLFKHPHLGLADVREVWMSDPLFYPAKPPAAIRASAVRSAATKLATTWPVGAGAVDVDTGRTDDRQEYDPRRGARLLRRS